MDAPKSRKFFWKIALYTLLFSLGVSIWYAGKALQYTWNFNRIPNFFIIQSQEFIRAPFDGRIIKCKITGSMTILTLQDKESSETEIEIPTKGVSAQVNEEVFEGDIIGKQTDWSLGPLAQGLGTTVWLSLISGVIGLGISFFVAFARLSKNPLFHGLAAFYVEVIRGTPLLVQLLIAYFFVGTLLNLDRYVAGGGALALFSGAYFTEILRGGIQSVSKGLIEASRALGLTAFQTIRYIVLPLAIKRTLPALAGQFISLVKDSSLVSIIAISDLTKAGREIAASTFSTFEVWFTVAGLYLMLTLGLSYIARIIERKVAFRD